MSDKAAETLACALVKCAALIAAGYLGVNGHVVLAGLCIFGAF